MNDIVSMRKIRPCELLSPQVGEDRLVAGLTGRSWDATALSMTAASGVEDFSLGDFFLGDNRLVYQLQKA
jgi:hypothetical protein